MRVRLLSVGQAARNAGVTREVIWNWEAMGLLPGQDTPGGRRYREPDLDGLLAGPLPAAPAPTWVRPGRAAQILHRGTETIRRYASKGLLTRDALGWYDLASVQALRERLEHARPH